MDRCKRILPAIIGLVGAVGPGWPQAPTADSVGSVTPIAQLLQAPAVTISNGQISARIYLPDSDKGFYRGSRFDWAGVIGSLTYAGHDFYKPWFGGMSPEVRDFVFQNGAAIAAPNTAATGPVEEFNAQGGALGFAEAAPGGVFLKIGVGVLRRPDDAAYSSFRLYPLVDPGKRKNVVKSDSVEFTQEVADPGTGYAYRYTKTIRLPKNEPVMLIEHVLRNSGTKAIITSVYDHNFLDVDSGGAAAGLTLTTPFVLTADPPPNSALAQVMGREFLFNASPPIDQRILTKLSGFSAAATDYDFHIVDRSRGAGVRITADQPLQQITLWSIRPVMAIEPFVKMTLAPGESFRWSYRYAFEAGPQLTE
jgi:hypothetical protein